MIHCNIWSVRYKKCKCSRKQETYKSRSLLSFFQQEHQHNCADKENPTHLDQVPQYSPQGFIIGKKSPVKRRAYCFPPDKDPGPELDLVKIAPQAKPPVCKIIDYGKYRYELARKEKEAKKKQKTIDVKEVRLSPNIDTNDLNTKAGAARKFLTKGDRVKVTLRFRGREMAHMSSSKHVLDDFADMLKDIAVVEKAPKVEGRSMTMFLAQKH